MDSQGGQKGGGGPATRKPGRASVSADVRQQADGAQQQDELQFHTGIPGPTRSVGIGFRSSVVSPRFRLTEPLAGNDKLMVPRSRSWELNQETEAQRWMCFVHTACSVLLPFRSCDCIPARLKFGSAPGGLRLQHETGTWLVPPEESRSHAEPAWGLLQGRRAPPPQHLLLRRPGTLCPPHLLKISENPEWRITLLRGSSAFSPSWTVE
nr:uncharacterized protein LOC110141222 [Odocoileus virginianus texanus]